MRGSLVLQCCWTVFSLHTERKREGVTNFSNTITYLTLMNGLKERSSLMVDGMVGSLLLRLSYIRSNHWINHTQHTSQLTLLQTDNFTILRYLFYISPTNASFNNQIVPLYILKIYINSSWLYGVESLYCGDHWNHQCGLSQKIFLCWHWSVGH